MTSFYDVIDDLVAAADAGERGDEASYHQRAAAATDAIAGTAGAIGGYEADYVLGDLAAALELDEPPAAAAARIRGAHERLRGLVV